MSRGDNNSLSFYRIIRIYACHTQLSWFLVSVNQQNTYILVICIVGHFLGVFRGFDDFIQMSTLYSLLEALGAKYMRSRCRRQRIEWMNTLLGNSGSLSNCLDFVQYSFEVLSIIKIIFIRVWVPEVLSVESFYRDHHYCHVYLRHGPYVIVVIIF